MISRIIHRVAQCADPVNIAQHHHAHPVLIANPAKSLNPRQNSVHRVLWAKWTGATSVKFARLRGVRIYQTPVADMHILSTMDAAIIALMQNTSSVPMMIQIASLALHRGSSRTSRKTKKNNAWNVCRVVLAQTGVNTVILVQMRGCAYALTVLSAITNLILRAESARLVQWGKLLTLQS